MREAIGRGEDAGTFLFGRNGVMLRNIIDGAAIGMAVSAMDGHILYTNRAFARDFSVTNRDGEMNLHRIFAPDDREGQQALANVLAGRSSTHEGEYRCRDARGQSIWAMVALSVLESDVTGQPVYIIAQVNSIDRRKAAEASLAESESRWHFALEAARQGVWDHDGRTGHMFYSPMWRIMRGIPLDEPIDDRQEAWIERIHPDDRERIRSTVSRQNLGDDGYDILEYRERHRDGGYIWILSRGKPVAWDSEGRVLRTIGTDTDITHLKEIEARLEHAATHDPLTGLANRASFGSAVVAAAGALPSCLMFIDLDQFKPINDALGHAAGDSVLVAVGERIKSVVRSADFTARIGGDEFVVLLRDCALENALGLAEEVSAAIASIEIAPMRKPHKLGASIGLVQLTAGATADAVLAQADAACYAAKKAGRGQIVIAA
ncbi:diguanylate cyclase [Devosia sp. CN2-171]|uniref:diguanylate cyclase n=1 Tax=Devosia sp. CN2-171 TaxID=3400909 RepID=UPI003BF91242